jgi:hypothetical protein
MELVPSTLGCSTIGIHIAGAKNSSVPRNSGGATPMIVNWCLLIWTGRPTTPASS